MSASSEKLFMTCAPKTSLSLVGASRRKVQGGGLIIAAVRDGRRSEQWFVAYPGEVQQIAAGAAVLKTIAPA